MNSSGAAPNHVGAACGSQYILLDFVVAQGYGCIQRLRTGPQGLDYPSFPTSGEETWGRLAATRRSFMTKQSNTPMTFPAPSRSAGSEICSGNGRAEARRHVGNEGERKRGLMRRERPDAALIRRRRCGLFIEATCKQSQRTFASNRPVMEPMLAHM